MEITVAVVIIAATLVLGEITKLTKIPNKYIPLQNIIIAVIASIVCILNNVQDLPPLEIVIMCIFSTMSAGGLSDLKKISKDE